MTTKPDAMQHIKKYNPCAEAREWIGDRTLYQAWTQCPRGDWLLWIAVRAGADHKLIVLAACDCAEPALRHVPDSEDRPRLAIETTRKWCEGKATIDEVRAAANAAYAAYAADAYAADAKEKARKKNAQLVRRRIGWNVIKRLLRETNEH